MYDEIEYLNESHPMGVGVGFPNLGDNSNLEASTFEVEANVTPTSTITGLDLNGQLHLETKPQLDNYHHCFNTEPFVSFNYPNRRAAVSFQCPQEVFDEMPGLRGPVGLYDHPMREVFQSMPHEVGALPGFVDPFTGVVDENYMGRLLRSTGEGGRCGARGGRNGTAAAAAARGEGKGGNTAEKHRREQMTDKFNALKALIPNPTKPDKASVVADTAEYIKELLRTVEELKTLVQRKRLEEGRRKKQKITEDPDMDVENIPSNFPADDMGSSVAGLLRSSWLQRRSKDTDVDVRIVEDEVNIKLTQRKKPGCLLLISKVLQELQLELLHLTYGNIGDYLIFMINAKIHEGSIIYASGVAKKLIDAISFQYAVGTD